MNQNYLATTSSYEVHDVVPTANLKQKYKLANNLKTKTLK